MATRQILVALRPDTAEHSREALRFYRLFLFRDGDSVTCTTVVKPDAPETEEDEMTKWMESQVQSAECTDIVTGYRVFRTKSWKYICHPMENYLNEAKPDLVVLGSSEKSGDFMRRRAGGKIDMTYFRAPCPVILVNDYKSGDASQGSGPRNVMVGVTLSTASEHAFQYAREVLARPEDTLQLVSVVEHAGGTVQSDVMGEGLKLADEALEKFGKLCDENKIVYSKVRVAGGKPGADLVSMSKSKGSDVLVVGGKSRGHLSQAVPHGVLDHLAHHANVPLVMVLPRK